MEKSIYPTSEYQVFCDTYDMKLKLNLHQTEAGEIKLQATMSPEKKGDELEVSLYKEDVEMLVDYLSNIKKEVKSRN